MPAFHAEYVELLTDHTHLDARAAAGSRGWTAPGDNSGLAVNPDFAKVWLDCGAVLDVRKIHLKQLPWPTLRWPLTG